MSTLNSAVVASILETMEDQGVSDAELVRRTGKQKSTVSRHLNAVSKMFIDDMEAYAGALGLTLNELLDRAQAMDPGLPDDPYGLAAKRRKPTK